MRGHAPLDTYANTSSLTEVVPVQAVEETYGQGGNYCGLGKVRA